MIDRNYIIYQIQNATQRMNYHFFHLASGRPGIINRLSTSHLAWLGKLNYGLCQIFMQHIWPISNKNIPTCERNANEIDDREHFQDTFLTHYLFHSEKYTGTKTNVLRKFIIGIVYIFSPFGSHSEYLTKYFNVITRVRFNTQSP